MLQFIGIIIFAMIQSVYPSLVFMPKLQDIIHTKIDDIKAYLQSVDRSRQSAHLNNDIYDDTVKYIEHSYRVGVV